MKNIFKELVTGLCALKNLGDPAPFIDGAPINVNGTMCKLIYKEKINLSRLYLYVVFGYAPSGVEALVFQTILKRNHASFEGRGAGFCISEASGKVGYVVHFDLEEMVPDNLANAMVYYADQAIEWRRTHFLKGVPMANGAY